MATLTERLAFLISANADDAIKAFQKTGNAAEKELGRAEDKINKLGGQLTVFGAGAMAFAGVAAHGLLGMAKASEEAEQQSRKLANSIANNATYAAGAQQRLEELAKATMRLTTADDDAIVGAQALLVQFGLTEQQVTTLTPLVVDLAAKMGVDLDTAAKAVAKAADGSTTALRKMGIQVKDTKDGGDAFANTVDALRSTVGGFAAQEATTFSGKMEKLKVSLGNLAEGVGSGVVDVFDGFVSTITRASDALGNLSPEAQNFAGRFMAIGTAAIGIAGALSFVAGQAIKIKGRFTDAEGALNRFGKTAKFAGLALGALAAVEGIGALLNTISDSAGNVERKIQAMTIAIGDFNNAGNDGAAVMKAFRDSVAAAGKGFDITNIVKDFGKEVTIVGGSIGRDIEQIDKAFQSILDSSPQMAQTLLDVWRQQAGALDQTSGQYKDQIMLIDRYQSRIDLTVGSQSALADATTETADSTQTLSDSLKEQEQRQKDVAKAIEETRQKYVDLLSAEMSAIDSQFGYQDAVSGTQEAEAKLNEVLADKSSSLKDIADAGNDVVKSAWDQAGAALRLAQDQAKANGVELTAAQQKAILRQELMKVAATLDPSSPLRQNILGLADDIASVPDQAPVNINVNTAKARSDLDQWLAYLKSFSPQAYLIAQGIGDATADGFERGIIAGYSKVQSAAQGLADRVPQTVKDALKIKSPSRLMADEVGLPITEGIAEGIADGAGRVLRALETIGDKVADKAADLVGLTIDQIKDVVSARQDQFDSVLAEIRQAKDQEAAQKRVADAQRRLEDATRKYNAVLVDAASDEKDRANAARDLADAQDSLSDASFNLMQESYNLLLAGQSNETQFRNIASQAGLTADQIDRLIKKYRDLVEAQKKYNDAQDQQNQNNQNTSNADAAAGQINRVIANDQAVATLQQAVAQRNAAVKKNSKDTSKDAAVAAAAIEASKTYAALTGEQPGSAPYLARQRDAIQYFLTGAKYLTNVPGFTQFLKAIGVPGYANGGIVSSPQLAMVGESGPEAIIPLSQLASSSTPTVVVNVQGSIWAERDLVKAIRDALVLEQKRGKQLLVA